MKKRRARRRRARNPQLLVLGNPVTAEAVDAYKRFHGVAPRKVRRLPGRGPDLVALGDLLDISYRPTRGARRGPAFLHKFGRGAVLAATADGKHLVLVPSPDRPFQVDFERGIVG